VYCVFYLEFFQLRAVCICHITDWLCQWEMAIFDTTPEITPLDRSPKKLVHVITSAVPTTAPNVVQIRRWGGFWANRWNITKFFLFIHFFINSPTGQTRRRIFTIDGSNDADSRKDVPFEGFVDISSHFGGEIPRKPQFWETWIGVFKPDEQNIESFMLSNLMHRFQPIFAQQ